MPENDRKEPLEELQEALASGNTAEVDECLESLSPLEVRQAVLRLDDDDQERLFTLLPEEDAADLIEAIPEPEAADILERLDADEAAAIINEMESDEQADVMSRLSADNAQAILEQMADDEASDTLRLMQYPSDSAGGLMISEYLAYVDNLLVQDVINDLRSNADKYREYDVQYVYVVTAKNMLVGVMRMRDMLLASSHQRLVDVMIEDPHRVHVFSSLEDLERFFDLHGLFGVPVVDDDGSLIGVVRRPDVEEAAEERASRNFLEFQGIAGGEELRSMPFRLRSSRRLGWLSINILLNIIAASVIAMYQETLSAAIALAVFLPIISDMSGCSGNQAVAVSMRELSLGLVRPAEFWRVLFKEVQVGLFNGMVLGLMLGGVALAWQGNWALGMVVAVAMSANTLIAVSIGGTVPLVLRGLGRDPALASGPILTTITDICGFLLVFVTASAVLPHLKAS